MSGYECVCILVLHGFGPTEHRGETVFLERDRFALPVPLDPELDPRIVRTLLDLARIDPQEFTALLGEIRQAA